MASSFQVVIKSGPNAGTSYPLEKSEVIIGRDLNNDIVINDPEVSRRHARLFLQGASYAVEDIGSTNGSLVNGQRLYTPQSLNSGELITLGEHVVLMFEKLESGHSDVTMMSQGMPEGATVVSSGAVPLPSPVPSSPFIAAAPVEPQMPAYQEPYKPSVSTPATGPSIFDAAPPASASPAYVPPSSLPPSPYAGNVPNQPYMPETPKKKFPVLVIVLVVVFLCLCVAVVVGGGLYWIDSNNQWCEYLGPVLQMMDPTSCPIK